MRGTSTIRLTAAAGAALLLTACSAQPAPAPGGATGAPATSTTHDSGLLDEDEAGSYACTEMGNAEGVSVDLSQVLALEGGDYFAEVSVPSLGASYTRGFAGNDGYYPSGDVEADLTGDPVEVHVRVVTERGDIAYETSDVAEPVVFQPNGARCDGENYRIGLLATPAGELEPLHEAGTAADERGRTSQAVGTACGVEYFTDGLREWRRVGGPLDDGAGGPPPGWNSPAQRGWMTPQGDGALLFEDERGHLERFEPITDGWFPAPCG